MTVLQTIALPLGYSAAVPEREAIDYVLPTRMSTTGLPKDCQGDQARESSDSR